MVARLKALPPKTVDRLLAGVFLVDIVVESLVGGGTRAWQVIPLAVLLPTALLVRRRYPIGAVALAAAGMLTTNFADREVTDGLFGNFIGLMVLVFSMAYHTEGRRMWAGALMWWSAAVTGVYTDQYESNVSDLLFVTLLMAGFPVLTGQLIRSRTRLAASLREKAERLETQREEAGRQAAVRERERVASELHDVVAHALGAMTVQASAARRLAFRDPARAEEAFRAVEQQGREALSELRRMLGVLRREDEEIALAPQPSLAHLSTLVRRAQAAGLPVELEVAGEPPASVPAGVDLTSYRLIQEALNEARSSGGAGRASVLVRWEPGAVALEVRDDGRGARRLLGIRERVQLFAGQVEAESPRGGGHLVRARLPLEAAA